MLHEFLKQLEPRYNAGTYDLLSNNCNNFSEELSQFLLGVSIPVSDASSAETFIGFLVNFYTNHSFIFLLIYIAEV